MTEPTGTLEELVAELVYERGMRFMRLETEAPKWTPGGNSVAQVEARAVAQNIIAMCREVKPLEWGRDHISGEWYGHEAGGPGYRVRGNKWCERPFNGTWYVSANEDAAKAAAEAHHQERVREMLR